MITLTEVFAILKKIVVNYPYQEEGGLNTFVIFDERADLNTETLGKSYEDYLAGSFWARDWYL